MVGTNQLRNNLRRPPDEKQIPICNLRVNRIDLDRKRPVVFGDRGKRGGGLNHTRGPDDQKNVSSLARLQALLQMNRIERLPKPDHVRTEQ